MVFSSPELKAQVSFSDRLLSGVRLSVRLSVCSSTVFQVGSFVSIFGVYGVKLPCEVNPARFLFLRVQNTFRGSKNQL